LQILRAAQGLTTCACTLCSGVLSPTYKFENTGQFLAGSVCWFRVRVEASAALWSERALPLAQVIIGHDLAAEQVSTASTLAR
jgi:hypothetical protein